MVQILINAQNVFLTLLNKLILEFAHVYLDTVGLHVTLSMISVIRSVIAKHHVQVPHSMTVINVPGMLTRLVILSVYVRVAGVVQPVKTT